MYVSSERANLFSGAVWLIGLGILFATHYWWPGIMFLIGTSIVVQGLVRGHGWFAFQGALWAFGIGLWFALGGQVWMIFIILGVSMLLAAIFRPPMFAKPPVDNSLE